jgi:hypothetical protein
MEIQIVLDRSGDIRSLIDPAGAEDVADAERRFRQFVNCGYTAAARTRPDADGSHPDPSTAVWTNASASRGSVAANSNDDAGRERIHSAHAPLELTCVILRDRGSPNRA